MKKLLSFLLLSLLAAPLAMVGQDQMLTVHDGTKTDEHVPFYCQYFYLRYTKSQHIIPAADLAVIDGDTIKGIKYYSSFTSGHTSTSEIDFYLKEVDYTSLSSFVDKSSATIVYSGTITIGTDGVTTIMFDSPYIYEGGNLLVGAENKTTGGNYPGSIYFYGQSSSEPSLWAYSSSTSFSSIKTSNFIPKSTFIYAVNTICPRPRNLSVSNITANSATVSWTPRGEETAWFVQYRKLDDDQWIDKGTVTSPSCLLDNLDDYTDYQFRVKPDCTEGADWTGAATFKTLWTMVTVDADHPYSTGFEGETCDWYFIDRGQTNAWARGNATQNGGSKSLYISDDAGTSYHYNNYNASTSYAIKPFHLGAGCHFVSFDWKAMGYDGSDYLRVALASASTTLTPGTTPLYSLYNSLPTGWIALDGGEQLYENSTWQSQNLEFNVDSEGDYIVVLAWTNYGYGYGEQPPAAIDNFNLSYVSCPRPNTPTLTYAGTDYAIINWTAMGSETTWNMQYKQSGANSWTDVAAPIDAHPYTLLGLVSGTDYQVRIQSGCGSNWTESLSFTTLCDPIDSFPFNEYFSSFTSTGTLPDCWNNLDGTMTNENYKWCFTNSGHNGKGLQFIAYSNPSGQTNCLKTPILNLPAGETMQLSFWFKNDDGANISVWISTDRGRTYNTALAASLPTTNGWTEMAIVLPNQYIGAEDVVFVFKGTTSTSYSWFYLDDVTVEAVPTCPKPKDLTVTALTESTATLAWTAQGSENTWEIAYSTDPDFDPDIYATHVTASENPFTLTGLRSGMTYYAYVRAKCSGEEASPWCNVSCSFYTAKELTVNDGTATNQYVPTRLDRLKSSVFNGGKSQFIIPASALTDMQNSQIRKMTFYANTSPYFYSSTFIVYMAETELTACESTYTWSSMTPVFTGTLRGSNNQMEIAFDTPFNYYGGNLIIGFYQSVTGTSNGSNVNWKGVATSTNTARYDNGYSGNLNQAAQFLPKTTFSYAPISSPFDLTASNISAAGATLNWHPMGNETHWDVFCTENPNYVPQGNTNPQFTNIDARPYNLTGLEAGRTYYVYVRANEGANGVSDWSLPCSFFLADQLTVNDGTSTSTMIPVVGSGVNHSFNGHFIIPAENLQEMTHAEIRQLVFYKSSVGNANIDWGDVLYSLNMCEVEATETDGSGMSGSSSCYTGSIRIIDNQMTIVFSKPYRYEGGNLRISYSSHPSGIVNPTTANWLGTTTNNSDGYGSSYYYNDYNDNGVLSFLPKVTFRYVFLDCYEPANIQVSGITTNSATLSWTNLSSGNPTWEIQYRKLDETDYTSVAGTATNPITLQGLEPSHGYVARVRSICGNDYYSDWSEIAFYTDCSPIALPYAYGFEDVKGGGFPPCWSRYSTIGSVENIVKVTDWGTYSANSGTNALSIYSNEDEYTAAAVLPQIPVDAQHPMNGNELVFYAAGYSASTSCQVGVMTDPNDPTTFVLMETVDIPNYYYGGTGFLRYKVSLSNYSGNGTYIAIRRVKTTGDSSTEVVFDDIEVRPISECFEPTDLAVTSVTSSSATLQWTTGGGELSWQVQYKSIYDVDWPDSYLTTYQNSITLEGLTPGTEYQVRVRSTCSVTETGYWTDPPTLFNTNYTAPFFDEFRDYQINGVYRDHLPGWRWADALLNDVLAGTAPLELTTSNDPWYIRPNNRYINSDNGMIYDWIGSFCCDNLNHSVHSWMVTPNIELSEGWQFSFDMLMRPASNTSSATDDDRFAVLVTDNDGASWTVLALWDNVGSGLVYNNISDFPSEVNFNLSAYNNKTVRFAFYSESTVANEGGTAASNTVHIGNINVTKCIKPELIVASNITASSADLTWTGHGETSWTLQYRPDGDEEWTTVSNITAQTHTLQGLKQGNYQVRLKAHNTTGDSEWSNIAFFAPECAPISLGLGETYEEHFNGTLFPACWERVTGSGSGFWSWFSNSNHVTAPSSSGESGSLIMPQIEVTPGMCLSFHHSSRMSSHIRVQVYVNADYYYSIWDTQSDDISSGETTISLSDFAGQTVEVEFYAYCTSTNNNGSYIYAFGIEDVTLSNVNTFIKQTNDGFWNETANWTAGVLPQASESVTIDGAAVIPNGYIAQANEITLTPYGSILIADGAQLKHNNEGVEAKVRKAVTPYTIAQASGNQKPDGWHLIASPMQNAVQPSESMISNSFDLYRFNQSATMEWENYQQHFFLSPYFLLNNGQGYLYANCGDGFNPTMTLELEGQLQPAGKSVTINLNHDATAPLAGFNLVGNPYACNVTAYTSTNVEDGCFRMNATHDDLMVSEVSTSDPLKPLEGFFVKATGTDASITFNASSRGETNQEGSLFVELSENGKTIDRLIIKDNGRKPTEKFSLSEHRTKIFALSDQREMAIVSREGNEQPIGFKAAKNGTYTLTVSSTLRSQFSVLRLIDNLTGANIDLLQTPSYTFTAKTTDFASRFRLVFDTESPNDAMDDAFAFISDGNIIVNGIGTIQMIDLTGRILVSHRNDTRTISTEGMAPGVYVLRLIQDDNVRTQKIVIQ